MKYAEIKNKEQRSLLLFVVAIALLVVAFTVLFYQYRLKVRHLENERKVNDIMIVFNNLINRNMFNKIEEELQKIKEQLNNSRIVESIDKYLDGLASKFIEQCNFLNDIEQRFALLIFAGFSPRAICLFMGFKKRISMQRKRLL